MIRSKEEKKTVSLLICNLRSDFECGRKVDLQTRIFIFQVGEKWFFKLGFFLLETQKKNPSLQNHISATHKITSKVAD